MKYWILGTLAVVLISLFIFSDTNTPEPFNRTIAEYGDEVVITFVGKIDGEPFEGGSAEHMPAILREENFIPGFVEGIVGMEVGETKEVPTIFPEGYHVPELIGKEAIFTITLNEIMDPEDSS